MIDVGKSILEPINILSSKSRGLRVFIKRDDLIHTYVSGNKWRKLKYNIEVCISLKKSGILTFGGAFSNHLLATASACNQFGFKSIGIVRGEELDVNSNSTLGKCASLGMKLVFVSREEYKHKNEKVYHELLSLDYPNYHIIEEGGANYYGVIGCQEMMAEIDECIDHVFVAQGTSTTSCGILISLNTNQFLHVIPILKGYKSISEMKSLISKCGIDELLVNNLLTQVEVLDQYHFGGYAKYNSDLINFIDNFYKETNLKLDSVYTGKVMFGMVNELKKTKYDNSSVLFIHTGGIHDV
ncbi:MAG: 1-aminocyclopropane-1-carboxylate deaminase [Crocinitomicaceae bacterium]|nr:1-aminocyclopropane-1-carboxylate deaminase [Crocinitomicaceae bacterium]|tara:strand:- start:10917 stop:11810 length:894 start_codon:yes stop_codon:yes gene_type:complete